MHHKAAVISARKGVALATDNTPTTHIIKVDIAGLDDSIRVEHFCMRVAAAAGLDVAPTKIGVADGVTYMLVSRYDRTVVTGREFSYVRRVHQEDFCQALGRFPREKYEKDGGPGWKECFALTSRSEEHTSELQSLMRISYAVFCLKKTKTKDR